MAGVACSISVLGPHRVNHEPSRAKRNPIKRTCGVAQQRLGEATLGVMYIRARGYAVQEYHGCPGHFQ